VLSRIAPVSDGGGIKLNVYGRGKTGKTRLACTFPKPMLLIGTEDGTKSVQNVKGVDFVRLNKSDELDDIAGMLRGGSKYVSVALDTAGGLQDLILKEILGLDDVPIQRSWGMAQREHWMTCGAQTKERLRSLLDLSDRVGMNVCIIAHERNFNEDQNSEIMIPSIGAALTPTAAAWLNGACDYICQAFIKEETVTKMHKVGTTETKLTSKTGKVIYCLRTGPHPNYLTGFRLPPGFKLPDEIVDPSFDKILAVIQGK
jgi:hypothetical protein